MNETRGNARTKPMREPLKEREINSLKDSEKTNELRIKGCLLHNSDLWKTPSKIYYFYVIKHNYYDPCPVNPQFDGLKITWKKHNFVNPPYSQITKWIDKAINEMQHGNASILLIPARTDTKWFRKILEFNGEIIFIQGRLHFNDQGPAPFPSMFVIFEPYKTRWEPFSYLNKEDFIKQFK